MRRVARWTLVCRAVIAVAPVAIAAADEAPLDRSKVIGRHHFAACFAYRPRLSLLATIF